MEERRLKLLSVKKDGRGNLYLTYETTKGEQIYNISQDGIPNSSSTWGYKYNVLKSIKEIPVHHRKDGKGSLYTAFICNWGKGGEKHKENFTTFAYKGRLLNFVILQMNKTSGTIEPAIPQIDWDAISDTPLWKEGKYDEAVLDVMGLKWNDDKNRVVEVNNIISEAFAINATN